MAEEKKTKKAKPAQDNSDKVEVQKDVEKNIPNPEKPTKRELRENVSTDGWVPVTSLGRKVLDGRLTSVEAILDNGYNILESQIVDKLIPEIESDLMLIGQSKGKFGGGARRVFKQTQKKTKEGNKPSFATYAVVGNGNGLVGVGYGKSKETVPAREKAVRNAKKNVFKIRRGCGSWQCNCKEPHSIPYAVTAKCGSVELTLLPAPKGKGLVIEKECQKILKLAGIKDVWSRAKGQTKVKTNLIKACEQALRNLIKVKTQPHLTEQLGIVEGAIKQ